MTRNKDDKNTYKARTIRIKNGTPLASILAHWTHAATRLHNSATFLNRNTLTGLALPANERHPNQQHAIDEIESTLPQSKRTRWKSAKRKLEKLSREVCESMRQRDGKTAELKREAGKKCRKNAKDAIAQSCILNQKHHRANYNELDAYFKQTDHEAYRTLPAHAAQNVLRDVDQAWDNWGKQLRDWKHGNMLGLSGRPGMPSYKDKGTRKAIELPAADVVIVEREDRGNGTRKKKRTYAQLPLARDAEPIEITDIAPDGMKLVTVQVNPVSGGYDVVLVFKKPKAKRSDAPNKAGGDLGLDNLLTIVVNDGATKPIIIDGRELKSINRYWNRKIAQMKSSLPRGMCASKGIDAAWAKRCAQLHDGLNQAANIAVSYLVAHDAGELVVGKSDGWKEDFASKVPTKRKNKQDFVFMPFDYLLGRLADKCAEAGILFVVREESYTSKASLVDGDFIPTYGVDVAPGGSFGFSGSRRHRGLYQSRRKMIAGRGVLLNADVNGAGNILRKEHSCAFDGVGDWRFLMSPERVRLSVISSRDATE